MIEKNDLVYSEGMKVVAAQPNATRGLWTNHTMGHNFVLSHKQRFQIDDARGFTRHTGIRVIEF